jgi:hypothetical protein
MNLGQLLEKVLPIQLEGKATGGTTTTIPDSSLPGTYDDDAFKGALAFIHTTTDGAAPQNQYGTVTGYADSTGTFTIDTTLTATVGAGDYYSIADPQYKLAPVLRVVNDALRNLGVISLVDTSLTTAADTLEYTLPLALKAFPLDKVELGNATDGWEELSDWYVLPATAGTQSKLVFNAQPDYDSTTAANRTLRIWYKDYHPAVSTYSSYISETIPEPRAIYECKLALHKWMIEKNSDYSSESMARLQLLQGDQMTSKMENRINVAQRKISKFISIRDM